MSGNKQVTKVTVYYTDGTFEEIVKSPYVQIPLPNMPPMNPLRCMVCGDLHGEGVPCPKIQVTWQAWGSGNEDPGR